MGQDKYAGTINGTYNLLLYWEKNPKNMVNLLEPVHEGIAVRS